MSSPASLSSSTLDAKPSERIVTSRIWRIGLLAAVVAVIVNMIVYAIAVNVFDISSAFMPLRNVVSPIIFSALGAIGATAAFALIARRAMRPIRRFRLIALVVLLVSLLSPIFGTSSMPGVSAAAVVTLMLMHVTTAAISVGLLTTRTRTETI